MDNKFSALEKLRKHKSETKTLENDAMDELLKMLEQNLATAKATLDELREMGRHTDALKTDSIAALLAAFKIKANKKANKDADSKRFSLKKASKLLVSGEMAVSDLAAAMKLEANSVKTNLEKSSKIFSITGNKVRLIKAGK
jgi:hypothetical protein